MTNGDLSVFEFDDIRVEASAFRVWKAGKLLTLEPKTFQVLLFLLQNRGRLVGKSEILDAVWKDTFVTENAMTREVSKLRKELGDDSKSPKYIQTAHTQGYRFIAETLETKEDEAEIGSDPIPVDPAFAAPAKSIFQGYFSARLVAGSAILGLLALVVGLYFLYAGKAAYSETGKRSIAILPSKPIDQRNRVEIYEIGIADSLIHRLGSMKGLVVRPLSATRQYVSLDQDAVAAGKEQRVDYVIASAYQLADGKIRLTVQLLNVGNGQTEDTYTIEKDAANIFAMQNSIAAAVGDRLSARFSFTPGGVMTARGTSNEEAYRLFLQGMYLADKRDPAEARKAIETLERAVELDPNYAQAWAGKAHAHRAVAGLGRKVNIHDEYQKSIEAINRALSLDAGLADAHSAACEIKFTYEWDFAGAESECKRAIEIDPNSSLARQIFARYLNSRGRHDQAINEVKMAIDLEPSSIFLQRLYGSSLYFARRYPDAVVQLKRVIAMDPNFSNIYPWLWQSLEMQGNHGEAFEWFMKAQQQRKADDQTLQTLKTAYQSDGWQGVLREQVSRFEEGNHVYFHGAGFNAKVGNKDKAFEYLEKSYQRREFWMSMLNVDPSLDSLRGDPRFDDLVRRVEAH